MFMPSWQPNQYRPSTVSATPNLPPVDYTTALRQHWRAGETAARNKQPCEPPRHLTDTDYVEAWVCGFNASGRDWTTEEKA
jgi:hypothetical protein